MEQLGQSGVSGSDSAATLIEGLGTRPTDESSPFEPTSAPAVAVGQSVGRYVVLDELGRGAMGRVLRAYDPKLQREVALKELYGRVLGEEGALRLVMEARAMAKLSHPNVVAVYDVEEGDDRLVVVMEYVAGQNLRAWTKAEPRSWQEVVGAYRQAGRGLAAAHAVELLHRDFKPDNVLMSHDGTVKVTDFGLAKIAADPSSSAVLSVDLELPLDADLTVAGTVMGTPRYMAPEQHVASPLTPSADQYAFCVALWEGLWGKPPFKARDHKVLATAKHKGPPAAPQTGIPRPIVDAIRRGLAPYPKDRWPSMEALLQALAWDPARRRTRWLWLAGGVGAIGLVGSTWALGTVAHDDRCTGAEQRLTSAWGADRRAEVQAAIMGISGISGISGIRESYATTVWERTASELDHYTETWVAMHTEACEATTVRGEQSAEVMDLRMTCLHRAQVELEAVTALLVDADVDVVSRAHELTGGLRSLDRCADVPALRADVEPPRPQEQEVVERIRGLVAEAGAAAAAGRVGPARAKVEAAREELVEVEYGPVRTEVLLMDGDVLDEQGKYAAAELAYREAIVSAARFGQRAELADAAIGQMHTMGDRQKRMAEGLQYQALAQGLAHGDPVREAKVISIYSSILLAQGKLEEAEAEARRALELREQALGMVHRDVAVSHNNLGNILVVRGQFDEAEAEYREALEMSVELLGPEHPEIAVSHNNLANIHGDRGQPEAAEAEHRLALGLRVAALGPDHLDVAQSRGNLALTLFDQGRYDEAEAEQRQALASREAVLGPEHPDVAQSRGSLAMILTIQGRYDEAEQEYLRAIASWEATQDPEHLEITQARVNLGVLYYMQQEHESAEAELRRALALQEASLGPAHPDVALTRDDLGLVLVAQGKHAAGEAEHRRALQSFEDAHGPEHPNAVGTRLYIAMALLEQGRNDEALEHAEWAWSHRQGEQVPVLYYAQTAFVLAKALVAAGPSAAGSSAAGQTRAQARNETRARARELAERALEGFSGFGDVYQEQVDEVREWLHRHYGQRGPVAWAGSVGR